MLRKIDRTLLKRSALSALSATLLALSFPSFNIRLFAWISFIPLFFALKGAPKKSAFLCAYLMGVLFWSAAIYWLAHVTLPGCILLVLYLALYFGLFGVAFSFCGRLSFAGCALFIPSLWVVLEYLRSYLLTGFPWALLGYSQYLNLKIIQISDTTGCWGVSFLVMLINVSFYLLLERRGPAAIAFKRIAAVLVLLIFVLSYGVYKLNHRQQDTLSPRISVALVQADIPQELKWARGSEDYILSRYEELTREVSNSHPELIIWPEAASPFLPGEDDGALDRITSLAKEIKIPLLLGAVIREGKDYFNSAILLDIQGRISSRYDKLHLVPFGEYIPLKKALPFLETIVPIGDIRAGKEYTVFPYPERFSVLVCFEDLFPELSREFRRKGAAFLVNITNDAWYKKTSAPYQHLQASVFRAVENRSFLARSANTGVSAVIDPAGRILLTVKDDSGSQIFVPGYLCAKILPAGQELSFYTRFGDIFALLCFLLTACGLAILLRRP